ncbi:MAG: RdgB/HAM1 family non-canonical purine NTP pyrophosphatase [Myxococcota bacterium]
MSEARESELVIATANPGKLREIRSLLERPGRRLRSLSEFPSVELPEEGDDYSANALAKARAAAGATGRPAVADDSGLEVAALGGAPGPRSARYGGPGLDDAGRVARLLEALEDVLPERRQARFVCVAAWVDPAGGTLILRGECAGRILESPRGAGGFGYDPVFAPEDETVSMAELPPARKNELSHRARAFRALAEKLPRLA